MHILFLCFLAAALARAESTAVPPPGTPDAALLLPAPRPSYGWTRQEKPGPDQHPGPRSGPGDGHAREPSAAESRGCVEAKAAACAWSNARAGERHRDTHLPGHSGFWNAVVQSEMINRMVAQQACCR